MYVNNKLNDQQKYDVIIYYYRLKELFTLKPISDHHFSFIVILVAVM